MGRIIEAKAVISAEDRTGAVFDKIGKKLQGLGKGAKASAEIERLSGRLGGLQRQMQAFDKVRGVESSLASSRMAMRQAQGEAKRLASALDSARASAKTLKTPEATASVKQLERQLRGAETAARATEAAFARQAASFKSARQEMNSFGVPVTSAVGHQKALRSAIESTSAALDKQMRMDRLATRGAADAKRTRLARRDEEVARRAEILERRQGRRDAIKGAAGMAGLAAVHKAEHFGAHALHTYQEFDSERRFGQIVMGLSDAEQKPLVDQAIHMGGSTRYNDVQVLEAQRELAARGLKRDQVMGLMSPAADLGMATDLRLPDAVKQMEGALFGFKKPMATLQEAMESARQTADAQVKAAKISGMTPDDISQAYKYGATPARMAGLSEQTLLGFAGISKKANMGGQESGTAFRALVANALKPTRGAKEAMLANGLDYKNYQKNPDKIDLDAFVKTVAAQYGVKLDKDTRGGLGKIFSDKGMIGDPSKFTPAVMKLLSDNLGGDDAKSKKSIAGLANRFRDASMWGVDTDRLVQDLMKAIPGNPALANAIFGSKQGARIANALGDPETFKHLIEELLSHSQGYAKTVADARMAGFDGAVKRLQGATTNAETKLGRAWDDDGKGGILTSLTDKAGHLVQSFAELSNGAAQLTSGVLGAASVFLGIKSAGLTASALGFGGPAAAAAAGLSTAGAGVAIGAGVAAYSTAEQLPKAVAERRVDPATGGALDENPMADLGPWIKETWRSLFGGGQTLPVEVKSWGDAKGNLGERGALGAASGAGADLSGQSTILGNTLEKALGSFEAKMGKPLEANVKPDQIQANVKPDQVTAKIEGQAQVNVTVKIDGPGAVSGLSATSSGNIRANAGFRSGAMSMPQAAGNPGGI
ncbi:hypothetical protein OPKNFCMD_3836 [Methylobacterium crusticola]|uniref:Phage tail tape measure protein domain-containing protein n=1 Tax=Methylobacterium crusticola TaxID=1697972 RepID=A0ABQ4R2A1_9HYPH|nr:phage tail tape measure protein [Methylobacterium crusticola]GJD51085.1 hypothetical protein OPKNFCMD_3836 [Methylobacterium crusticola]